MDLHRCYEVLGIPYGSSLEEIKEAYKVKVKFYHPDRFQGDKKQQEHAESMLKDVNDAYQTLCDFIAKNGTPPKEDKQQEKGNKYSQEDTNNDFRPTDAGNAKRLVSYYGSKIKFAGGRWYVWNGKFWQMDNGKIEIMRLAKDTANKIFQEAKEIAGPDKRRRLEKWAHYSEAEPRLNAMIKLTASEPDISTSPEQFDDNKWLFNVENGTINLKTGECTEHRKEDLISKISPIMYSKDAQCPEWNNFLSSITEGSEELQSFLKRIIGYTLTGDTREQYLFFLYGKGANGKSTFLEVIRALLGDYAQQADFNTFTTNTNNIRNDLARLMGARFVSGVEVAEGKQFDEVLIKRITGGDTITVRFLYHEPFEFKPIFKAFLAANHRPVIRGTDHAIWRRVCLIPFIATFEGQKKMKGLDKKLKIELPGILNWAIEGCREWQKHGLHIPDVIKNATQDYRNEMDIIGNFLDECCNIKAGCRVAKGELYASYCSWCKENDENPINKRTFGQKMKERGTEENKSNNTRYWLGIELLPGNDKQADTSDNDAGQVFQNNEAPDFPENYGDNLPENYDDLKEFEEFTTTHRDEINSSTEGEYSFDLNQPKTVVTDSSQQIKSDPLAGISEKELQELQELQDTFNRVLLKKRRR